MRERVALVRWRRRPSRLQKRGSKERALPLKNQMWSRVGRDPRHCHCHRHPYPREQPGRWRYCFCPTFACHCQPFTDMSQEILRKGLSNQLGQWGWCWLCCPKRRRSGEAEGTRRDQVQFKVLWIGSWRADVCVFGCCGYFWIGWNSNGNIKMDHRNTRWQVPSEVQGVAAGAGGGSGMAQIRRFGFLAVDIGATGKEVIKVWLPANGPRVGHSGTVFYFYLQCQMLSGLTIRFVFCFVITPYCYLIFIFLSGNCGPSATMRQQNKQGQSGFCSNLPPVCISSHSPTGRRHQRGWRLGNLSETLRSTLIHNPS